MGIKQTMARRSGPRRPRDLTRYASALTMAEFFEEQAAMLRERVARDPKLVVRARLNMSFWSESWTAAAKGSK